MARIRTIKPDFWTDEKLTECSLSARLLFIGTWNFADDNGNLQASAKKLKMQIFPADNIDCQPLLDELIAHGILIEYSVNEEKYLHIKGFKKHQVINRPSKTNIPQCILSEYSLNTQEELTDGREGKGREGNILLLPNGSSCPQQPEEKPTECPHQEIISLYAKHLPTGIFPKSWSGDRAAKLRARWREEEKRQSLDWWNKFFAYCSKSDFLTGKTHSKDRPPFEVSLDWIVSPKNFANIIDGKYHRESAA